MEPAEPLSEKPSLSDSEQKGLTIILEHHSMLTPSNFNFSVLRNSTQNFKYRGIAWLTEQNFIFKGFPIVKMGATQVSEKLMKPFCEIETTESPYTLIIPLETISDIFIGHDSTFQKRFQRYPKLRLQYKSANGSETVYFYLTRENLLDDELYINKRCTEWKNKLTELIQKVKGAPVAPESPAIPKVPTTPPPKITTPTTAPAATIPKVKGIGTDALLQKAVEEVGAKRFGKVVVKPLEEREKPKFEALSAPVKAVEEEEPEPEFVKLLDTLVPISDKEFSIATADSSIARCPHCGWILGYATSKCPRCRKEI
ncbi:MAG: hypothetical protein ACTSQI_02890 [Candidatus Helarchaeota archaeon]